MVFWRKKKSKTSDVAETHPEGSNQEPTLGVTSSDNRDSSENDPQANPASWYQRLRGALTKTNQVLRTDIRDLWKSEGQLVDDDFLRDLFAILVKSDMGSKAATRIRERIQSQFRGRKVHMQEVLELIHTELRDTLQAEQVSLQMNPEGPTVILFVGVNGSGKTTSIAKLAYRMKQAGYRVLLGAGDTFRAAAVEQLRIWSERIGCDIVLGEQGGDPGTVAFKATKKAAEEGYDVCIIDTAGRLQTQTNLMAQLSKVRRVAEKHVDGAPHEVLLVLDATAGQNAISQAKGFSEAAGCTGIVLSKLDGSAKGGVIIPVLEEFKLPVKFVGLGEQMSDLADFDPEEFSRALFDLEE